MGQSPAGPLRRRLCRAGALSEGTAAGAYRRHTGKVAWTGNQSGQDAGAQRKGRGPGFSGLQLLLRQQPSLPRHAGAEYAPVQKAVQRQKEALRDLTGPRARTVPVTELKLDRENPDHETNKPTAS